MTAAERAVAHHVASFGDEWSRMVRDPLWRAYGGVDTPAARRAYVGRRLAQVRRGWRGYEHRPDVAALIEAIAAWEAGE